MTTLDLPEVHRSAPAVRIENVVKKFGNVTVLDGINMSAQQGDFVSLVGPSGCGKSTLLKVIAGLFEISAGSVVINGMEPRNAREEMAFIFQDANLLPWKRVLGNTELPLLLQGVAKDRRQKRAREMLELVDLTAAMDRYPWQLSGGMRMRVSIARALTLAPRILLLDEPFGALDEMTRDRLNEDLLKIHARDRWAAFFVTHSAAEAVFLSNRVVVLSANPGRISQIIEIDLPHPRTALLRETEPYLRLVAKVSRALRTVH
jgi:NitT/TauT family transport system ATP-binding protein